MRLKLTLLTGLMVVLTVAACGGNEPIARVASPCPSQVIITLYDENGQRAGVSTIESHSVSEAEVRSSPTDNWSAGLGGNEDRPHRERFRVGVENGVVVIPAESCPGVLHPD
jgi:hypothetical protein